MLNRLRQSLKQYSFCLTNEVSAGVLEGRKWLHNSLTWISPSPSSNIWKDEMRRDWGVSKAYQLLFLIVISYNSSHVGHFWLHHQWYEDRGFLCDEVGFWSVRSLRQCENHIVTARPFPPIHAASARLWQPADHKELQWSLYRQRLQCRADSINNSSEDAGVSRDPWTGSWAAT